MRLVGAQTVQPQQPLPPPSGVPGDLIVIGLSASAITTLAIGLFTYLVKFWVDTNAKAIVEAKEAASKGFLENREAINDCRQGHAQRILEMQAIYSRDIKELVARQQRLEVELAKNYVSRQDYLRQQLIHNAAFDRIYDLLKTGAPRD